MKKISAAVIAVMALTIGLSAQEKKREWKDRAEYDLYVAVTSAKTPADRLTDLDKWKSGYAQSDYADVRLQAYLITYGQLNRAQDSVNTAQEILKTDPNDFRALNAIIAAVYQLSALGAAPTPAGTAALDLGEKTSRYVLDNLDAIYAADKKPQGVADGDWAKAKNDEKLAAQRTLGYVYMQRKDNEKAATELTKSVQMDPTQAQVSYWLAGVLYAQAKAKPEVVPSALYSYARAAAYDGPGSLPAAGRAQVETFLKRAYTTYHGSAAGLDQLEAQAKANALPAGDIKIDSVVDIEKAKIAKEEEEKKADPMGALWKDLRTQLTGDNGQSYFDSGMKDADLPGGANGVTKFKGKIISMTPENRPKEVVISIGDGTTPDATLKFDPALPGKMEPGETLEFNGTAKEFTKSPFMVIFEVDKDNLVGWTGKNAAPARKKAAPATKKQ